MARKVKFDYLSIGRRKKEAKGYLYKGIIFRTKADVKKYDKILQEQERKYRKSAKGKVARLSLATIEAAIGAGGLAAGQPVSALFFIPAAQLVVPEKYQRKVSRRIKSAKERVKKLV